VENFTEKKLELFPYKLQLVQKIRRGDKSRRLAFCNWLLKKLQVNSDFIKFLFMSDEAHFHLDLTVNKNLGEDSLIITFVL